MKADLTKGPIALPLTAHAQRRKAVVGKQTVGQGFGASVAEAVVVWKTAQRNGNTELKLGIPLASRSTYWKGRGTAATGWFSATLTALLPRILLCCKLEVG